MKTVRLRSSDGERFELAEEAIGRASGMIKGMLEDGCAADVIPLPNVTGPILSRVLEYVNKHFSDPEEDNFQIPNADDPLKRFDDGFVQVDCQDTLFDLILAANYLNMQSLLDLTCKTVAEQMKGKTIVAGFGVDATFHDPGSIDPDRGSGTRTDRHGSAPDHDPVRSLLILYSCS